MTNRRVVAVNTSDVGGGAERIARDLNAGLHSREWDTWLVVGDRKSDDPRVLTFYDSPHVDYRPFSNPVTIGRIETERHRRIRKGRQDYCHPYSRLLPEVTGEKPDIVHLHNLHGGYFDLRVLPEISKQFPTFVTLEDCWWFTGHCAYPLGCERWLKHCGGCPQLDLPPEPKARDATRANRSEKRSIYRESRLFVASPSRWLLNQAEKSILHPAISEARVIPHGIDTKLFSPGSRDEARQRLGLDKEDFVVVFSAYGARSNPFKDFATIREATRIAAERIPRTILLPVGESGKAETIGKARVRPIPYVSDPEDMVNIYRASDVYLHAAKNEAFGIVIAEALACGLPVIATSVDGIPEVLEHSGAGILTPSGNPGAMAEALVSLASDPARRKDMGRSGIDHARKRLDVRTMVDRYESWYREILDENP